MDFESLKFDPGNDTFIYFDSPYKPINVDSNFTEYSMSKFNYSDQIRLARMIKRYARSDAKIFLSNSDDLFFENTYHEFNISKVNARRAVNSNSAGRHEINELVIRNFI